MSVAIFNEKVMIDLISEKITNNKIDKLSLLIKNMIDSLKLDNLDKIFFTKGPGSYTAIRSIKALAQGMSVLSNAKVIAVDNFQIYLNSLKLRPEPKSVTVFFKDFSEKYFLRNYTFSKEKIYIPVNDFKCINLERLEFKIEKTLESNNEILFVTDKSFILNKKLENFRKKFEFIKPNATSVANAYFSGYGTENLDIIYHHTYYE
jgi:tRNA A37 threonylcarbamoyladenosine modification protein TsaB